MRVVYAANRALPLRAIAEHVVTSLAALPMDARVLLRRPLRRRPEPFETMVADLCTALGIEVEWFRPEPGGRAKVYSRDVDMVTSADKVVGYFAGREYWSSGTAHILEIAIESELQVAAWVWDEPADALDWLGEA